MPQIWQGAEQFDTWTFTNLGSMEGTIQPAAKAVSGTRSADFSLTGGGANRQVDYTPGGVLFVEPVGTEGTITVAADTAANMRIRGKMAISDGDDDANSIIARRLANGDYYLLYLAANSNSFQGYRFVAGAFTNLFSTAQAYTNNQRIEVELSLAGGNQTWRDLTNGLLQNTSDGNISGTGGYGIRTTALIGAVGRFPYLRRMTSATSGTAVSTTFDAGSPVSFDTLIWGESLDGGNITWDVSAVASGSPNYTITSLTDPEGSSFTRTSARYWHVRANFTRTTAQNPAILRGVALADNNPSAGGGGGGSGGGATRRGKRRIVVITEEELDKMRRRS